MRGNQSNQGLAPAAIAFGQQQLHGGGKHHHDKQPTDLTGATDTLYLCNFRVSVDGDWLCLKELADIDEAGATLPQEGGNSGNSAVVANNNKNTNNQYENVKCDEKVVERDWVNYYCRCYFFSPSLTSFFFSPILF